MKAKIFISCRDDAEGYAARVRDVLKTCGISFINISGIAHDCEFVGTIDAAVGACDALFVVIGRHWLGGPEPGHRLIDQPNDFVRLEIGAAFKRGIPVVPILLPGAIMPTAEELPADIAPLARRRALEVTDQDFDRDIELLLVVDRLRRNFSDTNGRSEEAAFDGQVRKC